MAIRIGTKELKVVKIRSEKGIRPVIYGIGKDFHLEEVLELCEWKVSELLTN